MSLALALPYRWEFLEKGCWISLLYAQCQKLEQSFINGSKTECKLTQKIRALKTEHDGFKLQKKGTKHKLKRKKRFKGKIQHINLEYGNGFVESNFGHFNDNGIGFRASDCYFDISLVKPGELVEYAINWDHNQGKHFARELKLVH